MNHCNDKAADLVEAGHLGNEAWELRGRLHAPISARPTAFAGRGRRLSFDRRFWERLNEWALDFAHWTGQGSVRRDLDWFGEVGTMACNRPSAAHNRARGIDLCQIRFTNGDRIDMNASHTGDPTDQRLYLAAVASLRRYFGTVLTCWYNPAHRDHLHVDDLTAVHPIRNRNRTDTTLIQAAANLLNRDDLEVDGIWGDATELAYGRLIDAFDLGSARPRDDADDGVRLLTLIMRAGLADTEALPLPLPVT